MSPRDLAGVDSIYLQATERQPRRDSRYEPGDTERTIDHAFILTRFPVCQRTALELSLQGQKKTPEKGAGRPRNGREDKNEHGSTPNFSNTFFRNSRIHEKSYKKINYKRLKHSFTSKSTVSTLPEARTCSSSWANKTPLQCG